MGKGTTTITIPIEMDAELIPHVEHIVADMARFIEKYLKKMEEKLK